MKTERFTIKPNELKFRKGSGLMPTRVIRPDKVYNRKKMERLSAYSE